MTTSTKNGKPIEVITSESMAAIARPSAQQLLGSEDAARTLDVTRFACGEILPTVPTTVRNTSVYLFHDAQGSDPNTSLVQLTLTLDALARSDADDVTLVMPYHAYARQDRQDKPHTPISARVFADLVQLSGCVRRVVTMDLHAEQLQACYRIPVENLPGAFLHAEYVREHYPDTERLAIVSPDVGGMKRAQRFAKRLGGTVPVYTLDKRRPAPNEAEVTMYAGGDIAGKDVILYDDMIDTGGTLIEAARVVREHGARSVTAMATHGLFSPSSKGLTEERLRDAELQVVVTDSIPRAPEYIAAHTQWLTVIPSGEYIASVLERVADSGKSVSAYTNGGVR